MDHKDASNVESREVESVQLITSYQLDLYYYVRSLVLDPDTASEVVQNTNLVLWEKREQFSTVKDFRAWAFQIARYKLLEHQAQCRRKGLCFSDALVDQLAIQAPLYTAPDNDLVDGLNRCVEQLTAGDRELLTQRYSSQASCENIAKAIGRPIRWVYKALNRIRQELMDCVERHGNVEDGR